MTNKEFVAMTKPYNVKYYETFGYTPKITDFSCGRDEYIAALKIAVDEKIRLESIIPLAIPANKDNYC